MPYRRVPKTGFTLLELIVSISIVGVLASLLIPAVQSSRAAARRTLCRNQLRQLGLGLHLYYDSHRCFPPGSYMMGPSFPIQTGWGWGAMVLPHIEQRALYEHLNLRAGTAVGSNLSLIATPVPMFRCPSEIAPEVLHCETTTDVPYNLASGNYCGSDGVLCAMSLVRIPDITDGTSQTLMLGERVVQAGGPSTLPFTSAWCGQVAFADEYDYRSVPYLTAGALHPINSSLTDPLCFGSYHEGGANFVFADGSALYLSQFIDPSVFTALGTPSGGESVSPQSD